MLKSPVRQAEGLVRRGLILEDPVVLLLVALAGAGQGLATGLLEDDDPAQDGLRVQADEAPAMLELDGHHAHVKALEIVAAGALDLDHDHHWIGEGVGIDLSPAGCRHARSWESPAPA